MNYQYQLELRIKYYAARVQNNIVDWYAKLLHYAWAQNPQN